MDDLEFDFFDNDPDGTLSDDEYGDMMAESGENMRKSAFKNKEYQELVSTLLIQNYNTLDQASSNHLNISKMLIEDFGVNVNGTAERRPL